MQLLGFDSSFLYSFCALEVEVRILSPLPLSLDGLLPFHRPELQGFIVWCALSDCISSKPAPVYFLELNASKDKEEGLWQGLRRFLKD
jgi:hypothetical protein